MKPECGWIKLYRKIQLSNFWDEKPFSRAQAWIDILLSVNHEDNKIVFDGNLIEVKRGQKITSIRKLCERWGWSNTKVVKFLTVLSDEKMLLQKSDAKKTLLTVVNYEFYQDREDEKTTLKRHRNDTETHKQECKELKNDSNTVSNRAFAPPSLQEVSDYCNERKNNVNPQKWHDFYSAKGWMVGKNKMKDWKAAVRTWEETKPKPQETGMSRLKRIARGEKVD
jgi:hypothetical protein